MWKSGRFRPEYFLFYRESFYFFPAPNGPLGNMEFRGVPVELWVVQDRGVFVFQPTIAFFCFRPPGRPRPAVSGHILENSNSGLGRPEIRPGDVMCNTTSQRHQKTIIQLSKCILLDGYSACATIWSFFGRIRIYVTYVIPPLFGPSHSISGPSMHT